MQRKENRIAREQILENFEASRTLRAPESTEDLDTDERGFDNNASRRVSGPTPTAGDNWLVLS
jgi:hypothetical protein